VSTNASIYELVRRDLLAREQQDIQAFGAPTEAYIGRSAILDAYDSAIDLACYLRRVIEEMTLGDGRTDRRPGPQIPDYGVPEYGQ
jgi:hypothetical protein